jgi:hypothetical protein
MILFHTGYVHTDRGCSWSWRLTITQQIYHHCNPEKYAWLGLECGAAANCAIRVVKNLPLQSLPPYKENSNDCIALTLNS